MTRKRFIKRMMADGHSRDTAAAIAASSIKLGLSYEEAWAYKNGGPSLSSVSVDLSHVRDAFMDLAQAAKQVVTAMTIGISSYADAMSSMKSGVCPYCLGTGGTRKMQSMAQIGGPSLRGPDLIRVCPHCLGTGRYERS